MAQPRSVAPPAASAPATAAKPQLLTLVDGPPLPNALVAWHLGATAVHILAADQPRARGHAGELAEVLTSHGATVTRATVSDRDVDAARAAATAFFAAAAPAGRPLVVDGSGGSRAMGLGVTFAALAAGVRVVLFDDGQNALLEPGRPPVPLAVRLTVADVLGLHGRAVVQNDTRRRQAARPAAALALYLGTRYAALETLVARIRHAYDRPAGATLVVPFGENARTVQHFVAAALDAGYLAGARLGERAVRLALHPAPEARAFFTGGWLEQYAFERLSGLLAEGVIEDLQVGVEIRWDDDDPHSSRNELDLAFTMGDRLVVVECKSAADAAFDARALLGQMNRLTALRRALGDTLAEASLVVVGRIPARSKAWRRARELGIHLFDGAALRDLDDHFERLRLGHALP